MDPGKANLDWNRIRDDLRPDAEQEARAAIILDVIAEQERLEVMPEDLEEELRQMADALNQPLEKVRQRLDDDESRTNLTTRILGRKAMDLVAEHAAVSEA